MNHLKGLRIDNFVGYENFIRLHSNFVSRGSCVAPLERELYQKRNEPLINRTLV